MQHLRTALFCAIMCASPDIFSSEHQELLQQLAQTGRTLPAPRATTVGFLCCCSCDSDESDTESQARPVVQPRSYHATTASGRRNSSVELHPLVHAAGTVAAAARATATDLRLSLAADHGRHLQDAADSTSTPKTPTFYSFPATPLATPRPARAESFTAFPDDASEDTGSSVEELVLAVVLPRTELNTPCDRDKTASVRLSPSELALRLQQRQQNLDAKIKFQSPSPCGAAQAAPLMVDSSRTSTPTTPLPTPRQRARTRYAQTAVAHAAPCSTQEGWNNMLSWIDRAAACYNSEQFFTPPLQDDLNLAHLNLQGRHHTSYTCNRRNEVMLKNFNLHLAETKYLQDRETFAEKCMEYQIIIGPDNVHHTVSFTLFGIVGDKNSAFLQTEIRQLIEAVEQHQEDLDQGELVIIDFSNSNMALEISKAAHTPENVYHLIMKYRPRIARPAAAAYD